ncbi:MAG: hypothetical protein P0121_07125 [Nitrospira sp.]|nr:hypothetical protein [Nitrospira sp.]
MSGLSTPIYYEIIHAFGYPGDPTVLPEQLREREFLPWSRRPIRERTFFGQWGNLIL